MSQPVLSGTLLLTLFGCAAIGCGDDACVHVRRDLRDDEVAECADSVERIDGSLVLNSKQLPDKLTFRKLRRIGQDLVGSRAKLRELSFPQLTELTGGVFLEDMEDLETLSLPRVERVEDLVLLNNPSLATLVLSSLRTITGDLWVSGEGLERFELPSLQAVTNDVRFTASYVEDEYHSGLREILLPKLEEAHAFDVENLKHLESLEVPQLTTSVFSLEGTERLSELALESWNDLFFGAQSNLALTRIALPSALGPELSIYVYYSPLFTTLELHPDARGDLNIIDIPSFCAGPELERFVEGSCLTPPCRPPQPCSE